MYKVELRFAKADSLMSNNQDKHYREISKLAHELDKDCEVPPSAGQVHGEYGSIEVKFKMEKTANHFIQRLQQLSYIQQGNLLVEACDG